MSGRHPEIKNVFETPEQKICFVPEDIIKKWSGASKVDIKLISVIWTMSSLVDTRLEETASIYWRHRRKNNSLLFKAVL